MDTPIQTSHSHAFVSDEAVRIFQWICFLTLEVINIFGTVTNIINIICFIKQGFKDAVNVSFLGLAVSDLGSVVTLLWTNICVIPAFQDADLPFDPLDIQYLTSSWPHIIFTRITSWITAIITVERCLCITMPLKVKTIITPRRIKITIICVFIILICSVAPVFYANRLGPKYFLERNKTLIGLVYTQDRALVDQITFAINNVFLPFAAFSVIIGSTFILVVKLKKQAKWRMKSTGPASVDQMSDRDQKISKMAVVISALFIVCFIPAGFIFLGMVLEPEFSVGGRYENLLIVAYGLGGFLESTNSSMNIFIYYVMSTRYRTVFRRLFNLREKKVKEIS